MQQPVQQNSRWYAHLIGDEMAARWAGLSPEQQAAIDASLQAHTPFTIIPQVLSLLAPRNAYSPTFHTIGSI